MIPLVADKLPELRELCQRYCVARLALFGSAARGDFDPEKSDLDFVVEFLPLNLAQRKEAYFGLLFALEDAFARQVDLVERHTIHNLYFRRSVEECQVELYDAA